MLDAGLAAPPRTDGKRRRWRPAPSCPSPASARRACLKDSAPRLDGAEDDPARLGWAGLQENIRLCIGRPERRTLHREAGTAGAADPAFAAGVAKYADVLGGTSRTGNGTFPGSARPGSGTRNSSSESRPGARERVPMPRPRPAKRACRTAGRLRRARSRPRVDPPEWGWIRHSAAGRDASTRIVVLRRPDSDGARRIGCAHCGLNALSRGRLRNPLPRVDALLDGARGGGVLLHEARSGIRCHQLRVRPAAFVANSPGEPGLFQVGTGWAVPGVWSGRRPPRCRRA